MRKASPPRTDYRRYYYTNDQKFEQSLDVWRPLDNNDVSSEKQPLVVLVVGSAWLGHRSIIYTGTSWWNSSGPRTFARLGCTCVCIRHRGAFPIVPDLHIVATILAFLSTFAYYGSDTAAVTGMTMLILFGLWAWGSHGSAKFDDMLQDVADALVWVEQHKQPLLCNSPACSSVVFGGYSSGGHVAATLLQKPELLTSRGIPQNFCDAVILLSGVLAVRQQANSKKPQWLTNLVVKMVHGDGAPLVPSPLHGTLPQLPHLLIECRHEMFGLDWLDLFFCSKQYADKLKSENTPVRHVQVESDHWRILNSTALSIALEDELQWLSKEKKSLAASTVSMNSYSGGTREAVVSSINNRDDMRQE